VRLPIPPYPRGPAIPCSHHSVNVGAKMAVIRCNAKMVEN
jgi:hypothetical protein